jgi:hypothetical protein
MKKLLELIYKSGKKIITIDLPEWPLVAQRISKNYPDKTEKILFKGYPFEILIDKWKSYSQL